MRSYIAEYEESFHADGSIMDEEEIYRVYFARDDICLEIAITKCSLYMATDPTLIDQYQKEINDLRKSLKFIDQFLVVYSFQ